MDGGRAIMNGRNDTAERFVSVNPPNPPNLTTPKNNQVHYRKPVQLLQKAMAALQSSLAVDDEVVLTNGIFATVTGIESDWLWVEVADGVQVRVTKGSIAQKLGVEPEADKKKKK